MLSRTQKSSTKRTVVALFVFVAALIVATSVFVKQQNKNKNIVQRYEAALRTVEQATVEIESEKKTKSESVVKAVEEITEAKKQQIVEAEHTVTKTGQSYLNKHAATYAMLVIPSAFGLGCHFMFKQHWYTDHLADGREVFGLSVNMAEGETFDVAGFENFAEFQQAWANPGHEQFEQANTYVQENSEKFEIDYNGGEYFEFTRLIEGEQTFTSETFATLDDLDEAWMAGEEEAIAFVEQNPDMVQVKQVPTSIQQQTLHWWQGDEYYVNESMTETDMTERYLQKMVMAAPSEIESNLKLLVYPTFLIVIAAIAYIVWACCLTNSHKGCREHCKKNDYHKDHVNAEYQCGTCWLAPFLTACLCTLVCCGCSKDRCMKHLTWCNSCKCQGKCWETFCRTHGDDARDQFIHEIEGIETDVNGMVVDKKDALGRLDALLNPENVQELIRVTHIGGKSYKTLARPIPSGIELTVELTEQYVNGKAFPGHFEEWVNTTVGEKSFSFCEKAQRDVISQKALTVLAEKYMNGEEAVVEYIDGKGSKYLSLDLDHLITAWRVNEREDVREYVEAALDPVKGFFKASAEMGSEHLSVKTPDEHCVDCTECVMQGSCIMGLSAIPLCCVGRDCCNDELNQTSQLVDENFPRRCCCSEKFCAGAEKCKVAYNVCCPCEQVFCSTSAESQKCRDGLFFCDGCNNTEDGESCCGSSTPANKKGLINKCRCCTTDYFQDRTKEKTGAMMMALGWISSAIGGTLLYGNGYAADTETGLGMIEFSEEQMPSRFMRDIANEWESNFAFACFGCAFFSFVIAFVYCFWACYNKNSRCCCGTKKYEIPM